MWNWLRDHPGRHIGAGMLGWYVVTLLLLLVALGSLVADLLLGDDWVLVCLGCCVLAVFTAVAALAGSGYTPDGREL